MSLSKRSVWTKKSFSDLVNYMRLDMKEVVGEEIWPFIRPGNPYSGQRHIQFEDVELSAEPLDGGDIGLTISGTYRESPDGSKESLKKGFTYTQRLSF